MGERSSQYWLDLHEDLKDPEFAAEYTRVSAELRRVEICKHCGLAIEGDRPHGWVHLEGEQKGLHRCALDPYGYDAAPASEDCSFACRGYERPLDEPH